MIILWNNICRDICWRPQDRHFGDGAYKGYAWYGIRHALFTNLVNKAEIHPMKLDKWGGWRTGQVSGAGMSNIYHAPSLADMAEIDQEVFEKHPFLRFWDGKLYGNSG